METVDLSKLSSKELAELLEQKRKEEREAGIKRREAYEGIRAEVVQGVETKVRAVCIEVQGLHQYCLAELTAFRQTMAEYGQLKRGDAQMSFTVQELSLIHI